MKNKIKYAISLILIGLIVVFYTDIKLGSETAKADGPNECCLNGYKLWFTQGQMGFSDCNCNLQSGDIQEACSCPKEPVDSF